jgi:hypothetical protein
VILKRYKIRRIDIMKNPKSINDCVNELHYHVVLRKNGKWAVKRHAAKRASRVFRNKPDAVRWARRKAKTVSTLVYIHHKNGSVSKLINCSIKGLKSVK